MDYMIRGNVKNMPIRFFAATAKDTVEEMRNVHNTTPTATAAVGRTMIATVLIGYTMKNDTDVVTSIVAGDGEIGKIVCTANPLGEIKCDIDNPTTNVYITDNGKLDVKKVVGEGSLKVIKDIGLKQPYSGEVPLVSGEIGEDFTYYFAKSEQTPSVVALGVFVDKECNVEESGGLIIQLLPNAQEEDVDYLQGRIETLRPITTLLREGKTIEEIVTELFEGKDVEIVEKKKVRYYCDCNVEKIKKVILSLGKESLQEIIDDDEGISVLCHFCKKEYDLTTSELKDLVRESL